MTKRATSAVRALIVAVMEGKGELVKVLGKQGYDLVQAWECCLDFPPAQHPFSEPALMEFGTNGHNDLTELLQVIESFKVPIIFITEPNNLADALDQLKQGKGYVMRRNEERGHLLSTKNKSMFSTCNGNPSELGKTDYSRLQDFKAHTSAHLAGAIAHDVNNLMTVIATCSNLLQNMELVPQARTFVDDINHASDRAIGLLRQLISVCREQTYIPEVLDLNRLIRNLGGLISRLLGEEIKLTLDLSQGLCLIQADPRQVEQVLLNLAVNARDAMPGRGNLCISTAVVEPPNTNGKPPPFTPSRGLVQLKVTDSGCGMDEATKARIFQLFFTTKEPGKGTGIGLCTVQRIIKMCGGHIEVQSERGQGSTFTILLPSAKS